MVIAWRLYPHYMFFNLHNSGGWLCHSSQGKGEAEKSQCAQGHAAGGRQAELSWAKTRCHRCRCACLYRMSMSRIQLLFTNRKPGPGRAVDIFHSSLAVASGGNLGLRLHNEGVKIVDIMVKIRAKSLDGSHLTQNFSYTTGVAVCRQHLCFLLIIF